VPDNSDDITSALPNYHRKGQVLRVIGTFPKTRDFTEFSSKKRSGPPIASLRIKLFEEVMGQLPSEDIVEGVLSSATERRRPPEFLEDEPSHSPTREVRRRSRAKPDSPELNNPPMTRLRARRR
jgi:hypothetical protein